MKLAKIGYFLILCEELNFTQAAKLCSISQPSLTNSIISLEKLCGGILFIRKPVVKLTPLGVAVCRQCKKLNREFEKLCDVAVGMPDQSPSK
jgi:LysR family hydrogen peroxide-inducible transcriptional activator